MCARTRCSPPCRVGRLPFALALSPDRRKLYVTNLGMFEYRPIPGADPARRAPPACSFPAFGFPSPEAAAASSGRPQRPVQVPGLGDPNVPGIQLAVRGGCLRSRRRQGRGLHAHRRALRRGPARAAAAPPACWPPADRVFVSNSGNDSITVIDPGTNRVDGRIPDPHPRPGNSARRAAHRHGIPREDRLAAGGRSRHQRRRRDRRARSGACSGTCRRAGFPPAWPWTAIPSSWPTPRATARARTAYGCQALCAQPDRQGSVSIFPLPAAGANWRRDTAFVMEATAFAARPGAAPPLPAGHPPRGADRQGEPHLRRSAGRRSVGRQRPRHGRAAAGALRHAAATWTAAASASACKDVNVTPNHHAIAAAVGLQRQLLRRFGGQRGWPPLAGRRVSERLDRELADGGLQRPEEGFPPGRRARPAGCSPARIPRCIPRTRRRAAPSGIIWPATASASCNFGEGFELAGVDEEPDLEPTGARFLTNVPMPEPLYRNTSREYPGFNMNIPDQYRAAQFIHEIDEKYVQDRRGPAAIHLTSTCPTTTWPRRARTTATRTRNRSWWTTITRWAASSSTSPARNGGRRWRSSSPRTMPQGGVDHIDAHRTVLLCAGPWVKRNYVSPREHQFPGPAEDHLPAAGRAAAQPVRRRRRRPERLLRRRSRILPATKWWTWTAASSIRAG